MVRVQNERDVRLETPYRVNKQSPLDRGNNLALPLTVYILPLNFYLWIVIVEYFAATGVYCRSPGSYHTVPPAKSNAISQRAFCTHACLTS